jgi:hypothetical protein
MMPAGSLATAAQRDERGLHEALASLARRTSPALLLCVESGALLAILVIVGTGVRGALVLPLIPLTSFGLWGLADAARRTSLSRRARSLLAAFQAAVALVAAAAVLLIALALGQIAIGTITS